LMKTLLTSRCINQRGAGHYGYRRHTGSALDLSHRTEACKVAFLAVEVEPIKLRHKERKLEAEVEFTRRQKEVTIKLRKMLGMKE
uniref:hypothetical protein n=1 Tax=Sphingobacterium multivorum TaxID=28454 RepID=UPI0028A61287